MNMKKLLLIFCALLPGISALCENLSIQVPDFKNVRYAPVRPELPEGIKNSDRIMDVYLPKTAKPSKGYPVVVFIHGGGFTGGEKTMTKRVAGIFNGFLDNGYAVVSLEYVLAKGANKMMKKEGKPNIYNLSTSDKYSSAMEVASEDALLAVKFLAKKGRKFKLNASKIAIMGGSAGAMTCLHLAFGRHPEKPQIKAVVNCWGQVKTSLVEDPNIPVFTIHGNEDKTVSYKHAVNLNKKLEEIGSKGSKFITLEGRGHAQYAYVGSELMDPVVAFVAENLK